ncbi:uncharacterized protein [Mycetomoellerius zeteki]|uniref:uncharacterized protein n=1 Tax=Mycetomoellerius zeteki TaxID=64791 RepID=UPI00084E69B2|nr:PREDICTED: uncharacterized protein LOC108720666 [Trachymyrmex zeteki]
MLQLALFGNNVEKVLEPFTYVLICIVYMYIANLLGQIITDHNNLVFITAYNIQWYKTPLCIQRMILFLLQVGTKEFVVNIGGVFDGSLECFATLLKASLSYFTVIYSTW